METHSTENFLKSLKSSNNVELAISAWANENLYIPSKGQFLATWVLNVLLKNSNTIFESRYWTLLESILLDNSSALWLPTLVYKTPVVPILTAILRGSIVGNGGDLRKETLEPCQRVLKAIVPIAYPKTRLETVLDCFWACLDALSAPQPRGDISELVRLATEGFRVAFGSATNKNKIYVNFIEAHFQAFSRSVANIGSQVDLNEQIWDAAKDIICSFEAIKTIAQQRETNHGFFRFLQEACQSVPGTLRLCSRLFIDQITATRFHHHALSQANVELHAWQSYASFTSIFENIDNDEGILAQIEILRAVEKHVGGGVRGQDWLSILHTTALQCSQRLALQGLLSVFSENTAKKFSATQSQPQIQTSVVDSLTILGRMNYDFLVPHIISLLETLACLPSENTSGREMYGVIIAYHSKTRTMDALSKQVFDVILRLYPRHGIVIGDKEALLNILKGCVLGTEAGATLSLAMKQYVTPGQLSCMVSASLSALNEAGIRLQDATQSQPYQGKKGGGGSVPISRQSESFAGTLALAFRLASYILPALPATSFNASSQELQGWKNIILDGSAMQSLKLAIDERYLHNWAFQLLGASALRFISSLDGSFLSLEGPQALACIGLDSPETLILSDGGMIGEFKMELIRVLLRFSTHDELVSIIQHTLDYLSSTEAEAWNGKATMMTAGSLHTGLTLLLTDRWLKLLESHGTNEQLQTFASLTISSIKDDLVSESQQSILPDMLVRRMLITGGFWELNRLQESVTSLILERTEIAELLEHSMHNVDSPLDSAIKELGRYFHLLLFFPPEALKSGMSTTLARRAILTDMAAVNHLDLSSHRSLITRTSCRVFASRFAHDPKSSFTEYIGRKDVIQFLVAPEPDMRAYPALGANFLQATTALLDVAFPAFIRQISQSNPDFKELFLLFSTLEGASLSSVDPSHVNRMARLLHNFASWYQGSSPTREQTHSIHSFVTRFQDIFQGFLLDNIAERPDLLSPLLKFLRACLRFRCMDSKSMNETVGNYIAASLSTIPSLQQASAVSDSLTELMWMLVDAVDLVPGDFELAIQIISLHSLALSHYDLDLDLPFQQGVRRLEAHTYEQVLKMLVDTLETDPAKSLIHSLTVALTHSPEGTFIISQSTFSNSIGVLNDISVARQLVSIESQQEILYYALSLCIDKPVFLRTVDIGGIWTLLAHYLQSSTQRWLQSYPEIFHSIIKIASALIRNRRDLVLLSLPHLAAVFCLLVGCLTKAQPNLGQKQRRNISNRLPHWLVLSQPLGSNEASLLSRLLISMTTKTIVRSTRTSLSSEEAGKEAQSLAKPFGKHASCVISSYIHLLNDPLCLLDRETRTELAPGLFALCGMLGEKGRDALMPTLDSGGKWILKNLWSSYESQKYAGKG